MSDNPRLSPQVIEEQLKTHATVMDSAGETIGTVADYDMAGGYFSVTGGDTLPELARVAISDIVDTGASGIYLNAPRDELATRYAAAAATATDKDMAAKSGSEFAQPTPMASATMAKDMGSNQPQGADMTGMGTMAGSRADETAFAENTGSSNLDARP